MKRYLAPMEGITGYIFRGIWADQFGGADKVFTPFLSPNQNQSFLSKEKMDIMPEHNRGAYTVPQILTNRGDYFLWAAKELEDRGYREVNLNLGCPSMTVVSKKRGSGMLPYPEEVDRLLSEIFSGTKLKISVKTRLGRFAPEEFEPLLQVYNRYPLEELILHPRIQTDLYQNTPRLDWFEYARKESRNPLCYNGDINTPENERALLERFPDCEAIMYGRGIVANPALLRELEGGERLSLPELRQFHDRIYEMYRENLPGDMPVIYKMKELWFYWSKNFHDKDKTLKKIQKTKNRKDYEAAVEVLFT